MLAKILAADMDLNEVANQLKGFLDSWWTPLLIVLGACAGIIGIVAGVRLILASMSGDENKLKDAKKFLIYIIIGIAAVFLLAGGLPPLITVMSEWVSTLH